MTITKFLNFSKNVFRRTSFRSSSTNSNSSSQPSTTHQKLVNPKDIFANNQLSLKHVNIYGFDYDYTLAQYRKDSVEKFIYHRTLDILVKKFRYPENLLKKLSYDPDFIIRGLHYDIENELVMKLDSFTVINLPGVFHGREELDWDKLHQIYRHRHVPHTKLEAGSGWGNSTAGYRTGRNFHYVSDRFSVPELLLICDIIQYLKDNNESYDGRVLYNDILKAVSEVHISGMLAQEITENLDQYLERGSLVKTLDYLLENNKKLFMLTNSPYSFVNAGMKHLLDYPANWTEYFELLIFSAGKPQFFTEKDRVFRTSGPKWSILYKNTKTPKPTYAPVRNFQRGHMYEGGCLKEMQRLTNWEDSEIIFFGDHVYADLADVSAGLGWRTAAIVPELEHEIEICNSTEFRNFVSDLIEVEGKLDTLQKEFGKSGTSAEVVELANERVRIKEQMKEIFNPFFGSMFRCRIQQSYFQRRLNRYAEIYTSDINNLCNIPLDMTFYPKRTHLPHEWQM